MPAPPTDLIAAMRSGTHKRHVFFYLEHPDGDVYAWDGIGDFEMDGDTYKGVAGFARIEGISDSGDIQNHEILVTLNGVGLASLSVITHDIRGVATFVKIAWLAEDGTYLGPRTVFAGEGDVLRTKLDVDNYAVTAKLRAPLADWRTSPKAFYTPADQARRFPGEIDTGFDFVKLLENATVAGWSSEIEATGGQIVGFGFLYTITDGLPVLTQTMLCGGIRDSSTGDIMGGHGAGLNVIPGIASTDSMSYTVTVGFPGYPVAHHTYKEADTLALLKHDSFGQPVGAGSVPGYIDIAGDARTAGAKYMSRDDDPALDNELDPDAIAGRIRKQGVIAGNGTPSATVVTFTTVHPYVTSFNPRTSTNWTNRVYCNKNGLLAEKDGSAIKLVTGMASNVRSFGASYVEDVTGNAVTFNGSNQLVCSGVTCKLTSTGVILTNAGNRVVLAADPTNSFLRVWT